MHFLYVDESGDPGWWDPSRPPGLNPSPHFILGGLAISEHDWRDYLTACIEMRRGVKERFGLLMREKLRGSQLIYPRHNRAMAAIRGGRKARVRLYREVLEGVTTRLERARFLYVYVDKRQDRHTNARGGISIEELAWRSLVEQFNRLLRRHGDDEKGLVFADERDESWLRRLVRRLRGSHRGTGGPDLTLVGHSEAGCEDLVDRIVEDPVIRSSQHSYFVQLADLGAHALYRHLHPKGSLRSYNVDRLFTTLEPLLLEGASDGPPAGVVLL